MRAGANGSHPTAAPHLTCSSRRATVLRSEDGVSPEPIFIAPYNAPAGQAGAVIAANSGEPIWENPLAGKVTTDFRVQRYRDSPVLTWWEGRIELGHGVGEYVIADAAYQRDARPSGP